VSLDVEDELLAAEHLRRRCRLECRLLRQDEASAACSAGCRKDVVVGEERGRGTAQPGNEAAPRRGGSPRILDGALNRNAARGTQRLAERHRAELAVGGGVDLDRESVGHGVLLCSPRQTEE
jgi:hypothetical protein